MARGFLSGALWGGVLSVGVGAVASTLAPLPPQPQSPLVSDTAPGAGTSPEVIESSAPDLADAAEDATPQSGQSGAQTTAPEADVAPTLDETPIASPDLPTTEITAGLTPPEEIPASGTLTLPEAEPVLPNPQALAPMIPQSADGVAIDTAPADPPQPQTDEAVAEVEETAPEAVAVEPAPETVVPEDNAPSDVAEAPEEEAAEPTPESAAVEPEPVEPEPETSVAEVPASEEQPEEPATPTPQVTETAPEPEESEDAPRVAVLIPTERPQIGTPAVSLTDREGSVAVNRLGTSTAEEEAAPAPDAGDADTGDVRPISKFAQAFDNPDAKPMMSIVLIDDGTNPTAGAAGIAALRSFPYALNFAVDSSLADAPERMALYRAAGFEVLAMVDLPEGAAPTDVETNFGVTLAQMNEIVGVLEGTGIGLQGTREVSDQVTAVLAQSGHGLITQAKGLNTMPKLARKEGVPALPVFRDFDNKGQSATVIRRFLDQAAFKAGQEGAVIMLGRLRPDTISALLLWGLQDRAGRVALAPISAVLTREEG